MRHKKQFRAGRRGEIGILRFARAAGAGALAKSMLSVASRFPLAGLLGMHVRFTSALVALAKLLARLQARWRWLELFGGDRASPGPEQRVLGGDRI
jgi:hypothetical protein